MILILAHPASQMYWVGLWCICQSLENTVNLDILEIMVRSLAASVFVCLSTRLWKSELFVYQWDYENVSWVLSISVGLALKINWSNCKHTTHQIKWINIPNIIQLFHTYFIRKKTDKIIKEIKNFLTNWIFSLRTSTMEASG